MGLTATSTVTKPDAGHWKSCGNTTGTASKTVPHSMTVART